MRVPRKKKKKIPFGVYCYVRSSDYQTFEDGSYGFTIKECPFYKHIDGLEGHCRLLKSEIIDQVKDCYINTPLNE